MKYIVLILATLFLAGCGDARSVPPPSSGAGSVGHLLEDIGSYLVWAGAGAVTAGLLAFAASFFSFLAVVLGGFRAWFLEAAILGLAAIVVGSSFMYLGAHPWLLCIPVVAVVVGLAIRYHSFLATWVHPAASPTVPAAPVPPVPVVK